MDNIINSDIAVDFIDLAGGSAGGRSSLVEFNNKKLIDWYYENYFKLHKIVGVFFVDRNTCNNIKKIIVGDEVALEEIIIYHHCYDLYRMEKTIRDIKEEGEYSRFCVPEFEYYKTNPGVKRFIYIMGENDIMCKNKEELFGLFTKTLSEYKEYENKDLVKRKTIIY